MEMLSAILLFQAKLPVEEFRPIKSEITNFRRLGSNWQSVYQEDADYRRRIVLNRNGQRVLSQTCQQRWIEAELTDFKVPYPVYKVQDRTGMGQGGVTYYYRLHKSGAKLILKVDIALPKPTFRDLDKDGVSEWMFLNGDVDKYGGEPSNNFVVYKVSANKELKFWKLVPKSRVK
jgi:hypothetical protein